MIALLCASQTDDETRLSKVRLSCLQKHQDALFFTAMLGYLNSRMLYWLKYTSYRAGELSKTGPIV
jgi:hypothetical protein